MALIICTFVYLHIFIKLFFALRVDETDGLFISNYI